MNPRGDTMRTPKIPSPEILQYINDNYTYNPDTGVVTKKGGTTGAVRKDKCITFSIRYRRLDDGTQLSYSTYAHQMAWYLSHDVWPDKYVDHIDGDRSNNRLANLRLATPGQNSHNQRKVKSITSSKFKGVKKVGKKWRAYINHEGKMLHLGYHLTEEEAAIAYDTKALDVFGAYAKCNFGGNSAISEEWVQLELPFVI